MNDPSQPSPPAPREPGEVGPAPTADAAAGQHQKREMDRRAPEAPTPFEPMPALPPLHCRDCPLWYGEEDRGWGPCSIKNQRGDVRFITFGSHSCDEGYQPPVSVRRGNAERLRGARSTSSASAVGYSSTSKQGKGKRGASRRRASAPISTRRRRSSTK